MIRLPDTARDGGDDGDPVSADELVEVLAELKMAPWVRYRRDAAGQICVGADGHPVNRPGLFTGLIQPPALEMACMIGPHE